MESNGAALLLKQVDIRGDQYPDVERYPFSIGPLRGRQTLRFRSAVAFLVGDNGSGKSTLMQAIATRCGLDLWAQPRRSLGSGELPASALCEHLEVTLGAGSARGGFFSAEGFRTWAEFLDDIARIDPGQAGYHGGPGLTARSHGEGILAYFRGRLGVPGLYFLDEPESALSPASQVEFLRILDTFRRSGQTQFLIATHSPILMTLPDSQLFYFSDTGVMECGYESTDHFKLYRSFFSDPRSYLS